MDPLALAITGLIAYLVLLGIIWRQKQRIDELTKFVRAIGALSRQTSQDLRNVEYFLTELNQATLDEYQRVSRNVRPFRARARDENER